MSEPDKLHLSDWFNAAVALSVAIGGGLVAWLVAWIKGRRKRMRDQYAEIKAQMSDLTERLAQHDELMAVNEAHMEHIKQTMAELKELTKAQTVLLHDIMKMKGR